MRRVTKQILYIRALSLGSPLKSRQTSIQQLQLQQLPIPQLPVLQLPSHIPLLQFTAKMSTRRRSSRISALEASEASSAPPAVAEVKAETKAKAKANAKAPPAKPAVNARKRKASEESKPSAKATAAPSNPKKKRATAPTSPPPMTTTPMPSAVDDIAKSAKKPTNASVARLADPRYTNALLVSPETSRIVSRNVEPVSPIKFPKKAGGGGATKAKAPTTTQTLLQEACDYLISVDERMKPLIEKHHCKMFSPEGLDEKTEPFESLCSGIISQQVSGAAAKSIKAKFVGLFEHADGRFPHPSEVVLLSIEKLRTAGLSQRKAEYIQGLAEKFQNGELSAQMLQDAPYEEVLERLIAVRGIGKWSVEMFACFTLKRMDVFSTGDLGVQRGMAAFVGRDVSKLKGKGGKWKYMSEQDMLELSEKFSPYRTLFMWYMWRVEDTDVSTME